jgi:hypothetical protein
VADNTSNTLAFYFNYQKEKFTVALQTQIVWLFILAIPIACVAWTITHEEVFREPREFCVRQSQESKRLLTRKFFYLFTCEYCFSHYVTIFFVAITGYQLLVDDWRGYLIGGFALVWIANIYMSLYAFVRIDIKKERIKTKIEEKKVRSSGESNGEKQTSPAPGKTPPARRRLRF